MAQFSPKEKEQWHQENPYNSSIQPRKQTFCCSSYYCICLICFFANQEEERLPRLAIFYMNISKEIREQMAAAHPSALAEWEPITARLERATDSHCYAFDMYLYLQGQMSPEVR